MTAALRLFVAVDEPLGTFERFIRSVDPLDSRQHASFLVAYRGHLTATGGSL